MAGSVGRYFHVVYEVEAVRRMTDDVSIGRVIEQELLTSLPAGTIYAGKPLHGEFRRGTYFIWLVFDDNHATRAVGEYFEDFDVIGSVLVTRRVCVEQPSALFLQHSGIKVDADGVLSNELEYLAIYMFIFECGAYFAGRVCSDKGFTVEDTTLWRGETAEASFEIEAWLNEDVLIDGSVAGCIKADMDYMCFICIKQFKEMRFGELVVDCCNNPC